jgi:hypothetical protein
VRRRARQLIRLGGGAVQFVDQRVTGDRTIGPSAEAFAGVFVHDRTILTAPPGGLAENAGMVPRARHKHAGCASK